MITITQFVIVVTLQLILSYLISARVDKLEKKNK